MHRLHRRLLQPSVDAGFTLIEVLVALMVFAIASVGLTTGAVAIARITGDGRARQVATHLAANELDQARTAANPLKVTGRTYTDSSTDPTHTFTITRTVSSISASGAATKCGDNTNFGYRRASVVVTWPGQLSSTQSVQSDTILAPAAPGVDAGTGAISVRVVGSDGLPRAGVKVTITNTSGGQALASQPDPTDAEGCTYADRVVPGTYQAVLSKTDYVDTTHSSTITFSSPVTAGTTWGIPAEYDLKAGFVTNYADNYAGSGTPILPTNMKTAFVPSVASAKIATAAAVDGATKVLYPGGYDAVAGEFADASRNTSCASMDPARWTSGSVGTANMAQGVRANATAAPGGTATFGTPATTSIPMGVVKVTGQSGKYLNAQLVSSAPGTGNPGCTTIPAASTFGIATSNTVYLALPFGSWTIYQSSSSSQLGSALSGNVTAQTNNNSNGLVGSVVTLDPRLRVVP